MDNRIEYFMDGECSINLADGIIQTEDGHCFGVHKIMLAKQCKYFLALFCNISKEEKTFQIPGIKTVILRRILTYIYTGNIVIKDKNVAELMIASDYLMMDDLLSEVHTFLKRSLSVDNCLQIFAAAIFVDKEDTLKECYRFVQTHFETILYSYGNEFGKLPLEVLKQFLGDRSLCVKSEKTVFHAITKWISADTSNRLSLVPELMTYLMISEVDEDIATAILENDIIANNPYCADLVDKKVSLPNTSSLEILHCYVKEMPKAIIPFHTKRSPPKLNLIVRHCLLNETDGIEVYITYDENIDLWCKVFEINKSPRSIICIKDCIYMFKTTENESLRYNISEKRFHHLNFFTTPRYNYAVVVLEASIFVLGGMSLFSDEEIYEVEIYDSEHDVWCDIESMFPVTCFAAVTLNTSIYVVGYKMNFGIHEMIVQVFNLIHLTWTIFPSVSIVRSHFALAAYQEKVYVVGGMSHNGYLTDVEVFDPEKHEWKIETSLPHAYYYPAAVVYDDLLVVYDNHLSDREYYKTHPPVYWNNSKSCWEIVEKSSVLNKLHLYQFITLENEEFVSVISRHAAFEKSPFS